MAVTSTSSTVPTQDTTHPTDPTRTWWRIAAGLGVVFPARGAAAWFFTIDDAYITFRYSLNLANGDSPV